MKLLFLGDTHGNTTWVDLVIETAHTHKVDWMIQVGDFGYWEHVKSGKHFLDETSKNLRAQDVQLVFIDGNHENHPMLRRRYGPSSATHETHPEYGFWKVRDNLFYAPRAHRWNWDGVKFMSMGGAYSVDKQCMDHQYASGCVKGCPNCRVTGRSWWPEEATTDAEIDEGIEGGLVDVLITHDTPDGVQGAIFGPPGGLDRQNRWPESRENRQRIKRLVTQTHPFALVHGHYHHRNTEMYRFAYGDGGDELAWWETLIEGLACDEMSGAALIWTTEGLTRR